MTTMTIHVEDSFAQSLRDFAAKSGQSVNQAVKDVLAPILGIANAGVAASDPYADVIGALPHDDAQAMMRDLSAHRTIDEGMWK